MALSYANAVLGCLAGSMSWPSLAGQPQWSQFNQLMDMFTLESKVCRMSFELIGNVSVYAHTVFPREEQAEGGL